MRFISRKGASLRLVIDPRIRKSVEGRVLIGSLRDKFPAGLTVEFVNGIYETEDKAIIKELKNHSEFGYRFYSDEEGVAEKPTEEAKKTEKEKKELAEKIRSNCPVEGCGQKFANEQLLEVHMREHEGEK